MVCEYISILKVSFMHSLSHPITQALADSYSGELLGGVGVSQRRVEETWSPWRF